MRIIDAHVHLYPPEVNRDPTGWANQQREVQWNLLCARKRKSGRPVQAFPSVDELLRAMDEAGVERAVLQGWYWESHNTCVLQNRFYDECVCAHPDRLSACATFHPGAGVNAVRDELRWARERGFCGLGELSPHSQLFSMEDARWGEAMELAAELKLPVLLHVSEPAGTGYPGRVLTPLEDFITVAESHPRTTFVLAHWGARLPLDARWGSAVRSRANVYFDSAASPLLYGQEVFREMAGAIGPGRMMFGSDYPLDLYPRTGDKVGIRGFVDAVKDVGFKAEDLGRVFAGTAATVFSLQ